MIRLLPFVALALALAGCANRYDVDVTWTLDGFPADEACQSFSAPSVQFRLLQKDSEDQDPVEEIQSAKCADGKATVRSAAFATMFVSLLENTDEYGSTAPIDLAPGAPSVNAGYAGDTGEPIRADIRLQRGRLHAVLTVQGKSCGDAGASDFTVTLRNNSAPLGQDVVVDGATVSCSDGQAVFDFEPVDVGATYTLIATTTISGTDYAVPGDGQGAGVIASGAVTNLVADLEPVGG